ncbi:NAD(P)-binding domain-containing protein [Streptomyces deserti]
MEPAPVITPESRIMKITVIGTGKVGRSFASRLAGLGHDVVVGTRDVDETLSRTQENRAGMQPYSAWQREHPAIALAPLAAAGAHGELIINATSGVATLSALDAVGAENLAGKPLIDLALPLDGVPGQQRSLVVANTDSLGERIQRAFPDARVVKTLNTVHVDVMVDPARVPGQHSVFVSGNDPEAKRTVSTLLTEFGWQPDAILDLGDIRTARGVEMYVSLYFTLAGVLDTFDFNIAIVQRKRGLRSS